MDLLRVFSETSGGLELNPRLSHVGAAKVVVKPWGEERWLVPEGSPFGFKAIIIRAGKRTSLQLHRQKEEANLVVKGAGRLLLAETLGAPIERVDLRPGHVIHILPGMVHRLEAATEMVLIEVSTPHLDDVVRIEDDVGRGDGRIRREHESHPR